MWNRIKGWFTFDNRNDSWKSFHLLTLIFLAILILFNAGSPVLRVLALVVHIIIYARMDEKKINLTV